MKKLIVAGDKITGLLCAYILSKYKNVEVKVFKTDDKENYSLNFGLEYVHRSDKLISVLIDLNALFSSYTIRGGILLRNKVYPHPEYLKNTDKGEAGRIKADYYRKTRLTEPDIITKVFNDPLSSKPRRALRVDFEDILNSLRRKIPSERVQIERIEKNSVVSTSGKKYTFDYLIFTIPLWEIRRLVNWYLPEAVAMKSNLAVVAVKRDRFPRWDFVCTPYTPADYIYRCIVFEDGYVVESSGQFEDERLNSDLNFLFSEGWYLKQIHRNINGYMLPIGKQTINWPDNVAPIGRFAKWNQKITLDNTVEDIFELGKKWFGKSLI